MSPRPALPPPPPPVEIRSWPDREAMLADRALVLGELVTRYIGRRRLGVLWTWGAVAALGWALVGLAILALEEPHDVFAGILAVPFALFGAALLIPAVVLAGTGLGRDREVRALLDAWGALDRDPDRDASLRRPGDSLLWLLASGLLCAVGLFVCVVLPATAERGVDTYGSVAGSMGLGMVAWLTGLAGVVRAFAHRRWVLRVLGGAAAGPAPASPPAPARPDAHG
ncbi:hypothetical protein [uncultured Streptomyces sp.]|uniref:hypothetical protein n=1 Tax=uncultured Streptomyces sp. TaxID=174707 RepID=UPI00260234E2|nr:hypothetical protein [uncultured Streptomyces sp.]